MASNRQIYTIPLHGSASAGSPGETYVKSKKLPFSFRILEFNIRFPAGCSNAVRVYLTVSPDKTDPSSGVPNGVNLLSRFTDTDYIQGNDETVPLELDREFYGGDYYIRLYLRSTDAVNAHAIGVYAVIEEIQ